MQEYLPFVFNVLVKRTGDNQVTAVYVSRSSYFDYFHNDCCAKEEAQILFVDYIKVIVLF